MDAIQEKIELENVLEANTVSTDVTRFFISDADLKTAPVGEVQKLLKDAEFLHNAPRSVRFPNIIKRLKAQVEANKTTDKS